jgi:hypothetical protein
MEEKNYEKEIIRKNNNKKSSNLVIKSGGPTMFINGKPIIIDQTLNKREKSNWLLHILFIRQEYNDCLKFIDDILSEKDGDKTEYALYLKALILRIKGDIH